MRGNRLTARKELVVGHRATGRQRARFDALIGCANFRSWRAKSGNLAVVTTAFI